MAKGVTEALLEQQGKPGEDTRSCEIAGRPFPGVGPYLARQESYPPIGQAGPDRPITKILMVHGIGTHEPGYSAPLVNGLASDLDLTSRAPRSKRIVLAVPRLPNQTLGELNVARLVSADRKRELMFFELTWSPINAVAKEAIAFDRSSLYAAERAGINNAMKAFVDDIAPDPLAYAGENKTAIRASVGQSLCWALSARWDDLPEETKGVACDPSLPIFGSRVAIDDLAFVSHSLGSRVLIDSLQDIVNFPDVHEKSQLRPDREGPPAEEPAGFHAVEPAAAARDRPAAPAGYRILRQVLRARRQRLCPALSSAAWTSSPSAIRTTF